MGGLKMLMNTTFFVIYPLLEVPAPAYQGESGSPGKDIQSVKKTSCRFPS